MARTLGRTLGYASAAMILTAYLIVGYAIYVHVTRSWPNDESLQLIPGMGILALLPGIPLLGLSLFNRHRMREREFKAFATIGALGVLLLPVTFALLFVVG